MATWVCPSEVRSSSPTPRGATLDGDTPGREALEGPTDASSGSWEFREDPSRADVGPAAPAWPRGTLYRVLRVARLSSKGHAGPHDRPVLAESGRGRGWTPTPACPSTLGGSPRWLIRWIHPGTARRDLTTTPRWSENGSPLQGAAAAKDRHLPAALHRVARGGGRGQQGTWTLSSTPGEWAGRILLSFTSSRPRNSYRQATGLGQQVRASLTPSTA